MKSLAIIGTQWGDEGKGKITDLLGKKCDLVIRYQGGNNAGHTIVIGDQKTVLHLIPSGILHDHCTSVIAHGVVLDPKAFQDELDEVRAGGLAVTPEKLTISPHCCIITSYHKILDCWREEEDLIKIGTTRKGIGPAYEDKVGRRGIKLSDLWNKKNLIKKLDFALIEKKILFEHFGKVDYPSVETEAEKLFDLGQQIAPFVKDTFHLIHDAQKAGKNLLYEGAQGVLLDIDYGSYPFVTSSTTSIGGVYTGAGFPGAGLGEALGITKAYTTRVGTGPFPTELFDELGSYLQDKGYEFGATTGRKRRCGWVDIPLLKYAVKASNITSIALTKLDVLSGIEQLKVCYAYHYEGREIDCAYPGIDLSKVTPLYKELRPFNDTFDDHILSKELQHYIDLLEKALDIPVGIIAYGPERKQVHFLRDYFM